MTLDELEEAEGLPAACFRRSVPIAGETLNVAARVPPALPPAHQQPGVSGGGPAKLTVHAALGPGALGQRQQRQLQQRGWQARVACDGTATRLCS